MTDPATIQTLPNGAAVLDRRNVEGTWIWLCEYSGVQPYVTWVSHVDTPLVVVNGHYHSNFVNAVENFYTRIAQQCDFYS